MAESSPKQMLVRCPVCGWAYFYLRKDFNKNLGCAILLVGVLLSPKTFGMSLAACALLDYVLYRRLKEVTICYICGTQFRGVPVNPEHKEFDLGLDEGYERIREEWRMKGRAKKAGGG